MLHCAVAYTATLYVQYGVVLAWNVSGATYYIGSPTQRRRWTPPPDARSRVAEADRALRAPSPTRVVGFARSFPYGRNLHARVPDKAETEISVVWPTGRPLQRSAARDTSPLASHSEEPFPPTTRSVSPWEEMSTPLDWNTPSPLSKERAVAISPSLTSAMLHKDTLEPPQPPQRIVHAETTPDTPYESPVALDSADREHSYVNSVDSQVNSKARHNSIVWNSLASKQTPVRTTNVARRWRYHGNSTRGRGAQHR
eukprot:m.12009 g.12009  ORF g.12009 m.12009 type:complete len:255 (-) comp9349_c0_seq1:4053-4817(-)